MDFIEFPEQNKVYAKDQVGYRPLPVYETDNAQGEKIMKLKFSEEELKALNESGGEIFCSMFMFDNPGVTPIAFHVNSPFVQLHTIQDLSPSGLFSILKNGSLIGNFQIGRDMVMFEIIAANDMAITIKSIDPRSRLAVSTTIRSYEYFSKALMNSSHAGDFFIINPKD